MLEIISCVVAAVKKITVPVTEQMLNAICAYRSSHGKATFHGILICNTGMQLRGVFWGPGPCSFSQNNEIAPFVILDSLSFQKISKPWI